MLPTQREQNGGVIWLALLVSTFFVIVTATALKPAHRGPLSVLAFTVGWPGGELAGATLFAQSAWLAFMLWWGVPTGWIRTTWFVEVTFVVLGSLILMGSWWLARRTTHRSMKSSGPFPLNLDDVKPMNFTRWWRSLVILPFRSRDIHVVRNVKYGPDVRNRLDLMSTTRSGTHRPVLFYIHGGAWIYGDKREQARPMMFEFARRGYLVVAINYRLSPRHRWPAQIEDARLALAWVKRTIAAYGGDPDRIVVAGGSAGGHLAALLSLIGESDQWRPAGEIGQTDLSVRGCISLYGVLDMTADTDAWRGHERGLKVLLEQTVMGHSLAKHTEVFRLASPRERIAADAPPFLLLQGRSDTLVDYQVARSFAGRYRELLGDDAPLWHVELPLTQHAYDLSHSPRTTATVAAAVAFADWAVSTDRPEANESDVPPHLVAAYQSPPALLHVEHEDVRITATQLAERRGSFFVVTPCNPIGHSTSTSQNENLVHQFRTELDDRHWEWLPSEGADPSSDQWNEPGAAIFGITDEQARRLARRWRQYAYYEVTAHGAAVRSAIDGRVI